MAGVVGEEIGDQDPPPPQPNPDTNLTQTPINHLRNSKMRVYGHFGKEFNSFDIISRPPPISECLVPPLGHEYSNSYLIKEIADTGRTKLCTCGVQKVSLTFRHLKRYGVVHVVDYRMLSKFYIDI